MADQRIILKKSYQHEFKQKPWPIGKIISCSSHFASELIREGIAEVYTGEYPPKTKTKTNFFTPK